MHAKLRLCTIYLRVNPWNCLYIKSYLKSEAFKFGKSKSLRVIVHNIKVSALVNHLFPTLCYKPHKTATSIPQIKVGSQRRLDMF